MPYTFEEVIQNEMIKEHRKRPQPRYPIWLEGLKVFLIFMGAACAISYAAFLMLVGVLMILHRQWQFISVLNILTVGYAVLFLKYRHYMTVDELIETEKASEERSNFSEQRIKDYNNRLLWFFCGIIVLTIVAVNEVGVEEALVHVVDKTVNRVEENLSGAGKVIKPTNNVAVLDEGWEWFEESDEFTLAKLLGYIIRWILLYWYVLAIIVFILYLIKEDYVRRKEKRKYERLEYTETKEFYRGTASKRFRRSLAQLLDRSEENLVRRAYYKRVKGEIGKTVERSDTPLQVGEKLPDAKELTKRYNEIRYKGEKSK